MYLFFGVVFLGFTCWYLYLIRVKKLPHGEALDQILLSCSRAWQYIKKCLHIWWLRRTTYLVNQNIIPYESAIKDIKACKYFKYEKWKPHNMDITELHFTIMGITTQYQDNLADLSELLEKILQDFYKERLGPIQFPLVYALPIQKGKAVFLVANNAYGNEWIQERIYADDRKDIPNMEELTDE